MYVGNGLVGVGVVFEYCVCGNVSGCGDLVWGEVYISGGGSGCFGGNGCVLCEWVGDGGDYVVLIWLIV